MTKQRWNRFKAKGWIRVVARGDDFELLKTWAPSVVEYMKVTFDPKSVEDMSYAENSLLKVIKQ